MDDFATLLGCKGKTFYGGCDYPEFKHMQNFEKWFDAQQNASNLEKIILSYEQATDISREELNIGG